MGNCSKLESDCELRPVDPPQLFSPACRAGLPGALLRVYHAAHAVEGLDVDRDSGFDKVRSGEQQAAREGASATAA